MEIQITLGDWVMFFFLLETGLSFILPAAYSAKLANILQINFLSCGYRYKPAVNQM